MTNQQKAVIAIRELGKNAAKATVAVNAFVAAWKKGN